DDLVPPAREPRRQTRWDGRYHRARRQRADQATERVGDTPESDANDVVRARRACDQRRLAGVVDARDLLPSDVDDPRPRRREVDDAPGAVLLVSQAGEELADVPAVG